MDPQGIIHQIFNQYLGRPATQSELTGFTSALQSGVLDPTGLALFIQGSSQFQQAQVPGAVQGFTDQLQKGNQNVLNQGFDRAQQQFAMQGRQNSSGLGSAFAQVSGNLAAQQAPQIAGYYGQLQGNALNPNQFAQHYFGGLQQSTQNAWQANQNQLDRATYADYYQKAMNQAKKNQYSAIGQGVGTLAGAGLGALMAGPGGGMAGAKLGAGLGGAAGGVGGSLFAM